MKTKNELYREALRQIASRRQKAVTLAENKREELEAAIPQLAGLEQQIQQMGLKRLELAAKGASKEEQQVAQQQQEQLQTNLNQVLAQHGFSQQDLQPHYHCSLCKDSGSYQGKLCRCVGKLARQLRYEEICQESPLQLCSFDSMDLSYYPNTVDPTTGESVRSLMEETLGFLQEYAEHFDLNSANLLLYGNAGLGKTHAALSVAHRVLEKGYNVVYVSAQTLFSQLDKERFVQSVLQEAVLEADLLILDDLGTEHVNPYMISSFYNILNTRLLEQRPTIYTTNIVDSKIFEARYTEKIASRLDGSCELVLFLGQDIRRIKNM